MIDNPALETVKQPCGLGFMVGCCSKRRVCPITELELYNGQNKNKAFEGKQSMSNMLTNRKLGNSVLQTNRSSESVICRRSEAQYNLMQDLKATDSQTKE